MARYWTTADVAKSPIDEATGAFSCRRGGNCVIAVGTTPFNVSLVGSLIAYCYSAILPKESLVAESLLLRLMMINDFEHGSMQGT